MSESSIQDVRDQILLQALPNVAFDGWSEEVIVKAADVAGYDEDMLGLAFPDPIVDGIDGFADFVDRQMLQHLEKENPDELRVRDRVRTGVMERFKVLAPYKEAVRASLKCLAKPSHQLRASRFVWRTADRIWDWAGDEARDYNRYTKRGLLSGILVSTTLCWLDDPSEDMTKTQAFLDRRIENVMQFNKTVGRFKKQ